MSTRATARQWARYVAQWKRSGESAAQFAARSGLAARQLYWWSWYLRKRSESPPTPDMPAETAGLTFLPVHIRTPEPQASRQFEVAAEVLVGGELGVRLAASADPSWAAELLEQLARKVRERC